ncbi:unnamed protein product [Dracunculus medinensis]|uniref:PRELI/MSF1 domain-containing protein n=1 Tax=Dracunculus medinensis TaxID=318479 RepID=A0A0N4UB29_DRAME|nr:unnamed protein product [Dracunculus medinensis]
MKIWSSEHVFDHPWNTVVTAAWKKYPNPMNGAVTGIDVIKQDIQKNGTLRSERILQSHFPIPTWATKLTGFSGMQYSHEVSIVDPASETMTLLTRNLNGAHFLQVDEKLVYTPDPLDRTKTILRQEAAITVILPAFTDYCEKAFLSIYQSNAEKGRKGIEWVIDQCTKEYSQLSNKVSLLGEGVQEISGNMFAAFNRSKP